MTRSAALYAWFNSAIPGIPAYPDTSVPSQSAGYEEEATLPYLTYTNTDAGEYRESSITVNIWFRTRSEAIPNAAAQTLYDLLGEGGVILHYDGGAIWLKRGSPFSQAMQDTDPAIKRRYINITAEKI